VSEIRCEITELITTQCAHCRGIPDPKPERTLGRPFVAAYAGKCRECADYYEAGDRIRRVCDEDGDGYLCPVCADKATS
jgi:hypothetical protein